MFLGHRCCLPGKVRVATAGGGIQRVGADWIAFGEPCVIDDIEVRADAPGPRDDFKDSIGEVSRYVEPIERSCIGSLIVPTAHAPKAVHPEELFVPSLRWRGWRRRGFSRRVMQDGNVIDTPVDRACFETHHVGYRNARLRGDGHDIRWQGCRVRHWAEIAGSGCVDVLHVGIGRTKLVVPRAKVASIWKYELVGHA